MIFLDKAILYLTQNIESNYKITITFATDLFDLII